MSRISMVEASIPNPRLKAFEALIGEWDTTGVHLYMPDVSLHGRTVFEWLEGGAFLIMRTEIDEAGIPSGIAIFGSDDAEGELFMLYFDERGVSRKYDVVLTDNGVKWSRNAPNFLQAYEITVVDDGSRLIGKSSLSRDGKNWDKDLELLYTRRVG